MKMTPFIRKKTLSSSFTSTVLFSTSDYIVYIIIFRNFIVVQAIKQHEKIEKPKF